MSRKWALGRRRDTDDDTIHIEDEAANEWWVERDALATTIDRRWRKPAPEGRYPFRRAADRRGHDAPGDVPSAASSPLFAPPDAGASPDPIDAWDRDSLFRRRERAAAAARAATGTLTDVGPPDAPIDDTPPAAPTTPWEVLGLTSDASWDQVVARHRELAKTHHPDRHGNGDERARRTAESTMAAINAAVDELGRIYRITDER